VADTVGGKHHGIGAHHRTGKFFERLLQAAVVMQELAVPLFDQRAQAADVVRTPPDIENAAPIQIEGASIDIGDRSSVIVAFRQRAFQRVEFVAQRLYGGLELVGMAAALGQIGGQHIGTGLVMLRLLARLA
jgi:hypothetical protein